MLLKRSVGRHCLTPTNPGTLCDPSDKSSCKTGEVCCPLIKEW